MAAAALKPTVWAARELEGLDVAREYGGADPPLAYDVPFSAFNPTPGGDQ
jgi:hypothetical protein